jgi:hypothetical protein
MSTFTIPNENGQIRQINRGDAFGELWSTFNVDLTSVPGKIKASKRLKRAMTDSFIGSEDIVAIALHDGNYYAVTTDRVFSCSSNNDPTTSANWSAISTLGVEDLGLETDAVSFNGLLLISLGTDIMSWNSGTSTKDDDWWVTTTSGTALTVDKPHIMHVHRGGNDTVFVTDGNIVRYYNSASGHDSFTLDTIETACALTSGVDTVWTGTFTESGDYAYVYEVQVGNTITSQAYRIDGRAVLSMDVVNNIPYIVTDTGHIQAFNGSGFVTVASFPFAYKGLSPDGVRPGLVQDTSIDRPIHPKGMRVSGDSLLIYINTRNEFNTFANVILDERSPSGVWEYNITSGVLNHRSSITDQTGDKGVQTLARTSPLLVLDNQYTKFLVAGEPGDIATSAVGLWAEDATTAPLAYFITPQLTADTIQESYEKVVAKAKTLGDDESIEIKYRVTERDPLYADITWLNTTSFTSTDDLSDVAIGDEVEIVAGEAAGQIAHVSNIEGTVTYTVTLDSAIVTPALNDTSVVRFMNWTKIDTTYTSADGEYKSIGVGQSAPWIQFKVVMRGLVQLRQFISKGNAKTQL